MIQRLLLLPGMHGTGELFLDFIRALPGSIRSDALCYPAELLLSYEDLGRQVRDYAPSNEPYAIVAESFSTPIAIAFAAQRPPNLKAVILCAGFAASPLGGWRRLLASTLTPFLPFGRVPETLIQRFFVGWGAPKHLSASVQKSIKQVKHDVLRYRLQCVLACDERAALLKIAIPMLYLRAAEDRLVPRATSEEILRLRPEIQMVEIPGPHLLLQANPKAAAEVVVQFLEDLDRSGSSAMR